MVFQPFLTSTGTYRVAYLVPDEGGQHQPVVWVPLASYALTGEECRTMCDALNKLCTAMPTDMDALQSRVLERDRSSNSGKREIGQAALLKLAAAAGCVVDTCYSLSVTPTPALLARVLEGVCLVAARSAVPMSSVVEELKKSVR